MVSLSLDGAKPETHDDFRSQPGAFDGTLRAIELFNRHDIPFLVNSSFTVRNKDEIPEIFTLVKNLGATAWYMFMIVPTGRGEEVLDELIPEELYDEIGVDPVGLGECHDPAGHVEQIEDCEMLLGLRHPTFVRSDDEQRDIDRLDPGRSDRSRVTDSVETALGVAPEHCIAFEDSPSGLASARGSGARTVGIASGLDAPALLRHGAHQAALRPRVRPGIARIRRTAADQTEEEEQLRRSTAPWRLTHHPTGSRREGPRRTLPRWTASPAPDQRCAPRPPPCR